MRIKRTFLVALGTAALAAPAGALAGNGHGHAGEHGHRGEHGHAGEHGHGQGKTHNVQYVFKGTYAGAGVVSVDKGNNHVRKANLVGTDVQFDLTNAKIEVADTNLDLVADLNDLVTGDLVLVQARLPKGDPGAQPFAARMVVDKTNSAEEDDEADEDTGEDTGNDAGDDVGEIA